MMIKQRERYTHTLLFCLIDNIRERTKSEMCNRCYTGGTHNLYFVAVAFNHEALEL